MTDKQIIIDGENIERIKTLLFEGQRGAISTKTFEAIIEALERKEQECERLKKKLNPKLKNAHCTYFEGQTGLCKAKEFTKCNPVNCKLYTIDELSTIVELQQQLDQLKAKNEELKKINIHIDNNRIVKAKKLKRIEDLIIACNSGYTDEFTQELLVILHEPEPSSFENKYKQTLNEVKKIAEPYQKEIKKICGNCNNYDDCHACCKFDLNCYQYKKGDTTACEKFIMSWKYDKNELANIILQKISEVLNDG